jgi:putative transposase
VSDFLLGLEHKTCGFGDTFYVDEVFVKINGKQHYLWSAVDQDGVVVDACPQTKRDGAVTKCFFKRINVVMVENQEKS